MRLLHLGKNLIHSLFAKKSIGARALIIADNSILLVKHTYTPGWYTVGGGVEPGESPLEAIKRELLEEVGITVNASPTLFSVYHRPTTKEDDYIVFFVVDDFTQKPVNSREIAEAKWYSYDNLPHDTTPATRNRIQEYLGKKQISDKW